VNYVILLKNCVKILPGTEPNFIRNCLIISLDERIIHSTQVPGYFLEFKTCAEVHFKKSGLPSPGFDDRFRHDTGRLDKKTYRSECHDP
jgi:hypothetical protein